jgi:hypothetical protein
LEMPSAIKALPTVKSTARLARAAVRSQAATTPRRPG